MQRRSHDSCDRPQPERASIAAASCKRVGGAAALATLGRTGFTIGANAQDAVTITMWGNHPEWRDPMLEILAAFEEANPGIKVEFTAIPGPDYPAKLQTAIAGGAPSDILGEQEGSIITQVAAGGELPFIDLTGKVDISGLTDTARGQVEVDGKVYGTPLASYTVGIAYQKPIFAEHGLEPPTTWDELKDVAQALKDAGVDADRARRQGLGPPVLHVHRPRLFGAWVRRGSSSCAPASAS